MTLKIAKNFACGAFFPYWTLPELTRKYATESGIPFFGTIVRLRSVGSLICGSSSNNERTAANTIVVFVVADIEKKIHKLESQYAYFFLSKILVSLSSVMSLDLIIVI
jgi:hypothetical protein